MKFKQFITEEISLEKKSKYTIYDKEFHTKVFARYVGFFEKNGAKYHKFINLGDNNSINLHPSQLKDYIITKV